MSRKERRRLVNIGKSLCTLNEEDIAYILDLKNSESEVLRRMTTARQRCR